MNLEIELDSVETMAELEKGLQALDVASLGLFLETTVDPWIKLRVRQRFRSEGDSASGNWLPLRSVTEMFRMSQGFRADHPINYRTGQLFRWLMQMQPSISIMAYGGVQGMWPSKLPDGVWMKKKFITAQQGDRRTPARPVLKIDEVDAAHISLELATYLGSILGLTWQL